MPIARSISAACVKRPMLKRTDDIASFSDRPMARNTCDGSGCPEVHAEPVEAATVGYRFCKSIVASTDGKSKFKFPGCRQV